MVATLAWSLTPVFIRGLKDAYDPYSQAFYRFLFATIALTAVCLWRHRAEFLRLLRGSWGLVGLGVVNALHMWTWTEGAYGSTATIAQLINKLSVVFVVVMAYIFYSEERAVIRSGRFQGGTLLSIAGLVAVLSHDAVSTPKATAFLVSTSFLVAIYLVWARHLVLRSHPLPMFAVSAIHTTLVLGALSALFGEPACILRATVEQNTALIVSGLIPIASAHPCYNFAQKYLGAALTQSLSLINPLFTHLIALGFWSNERLSLLQWLGASALIAGTLLTSTGGGAVPSKSSPIE